MLAENIRKSFSFIVLFQRSTTDDFSSFSVVYNFIPFLLRRSFIIALKNSLPLSDQSIFGFRFARSLNMDRKESATVCPRLSFRGRIHPNFEKTSITIRRYLIPLFHFENFPISTRSAAQMLSIPYETTLLFGNCRLIG